MRSLANMTTLPTASLLIISLTAHRAGPAGVKGMPLDQKLKLSWKKCAKGTSIISNVAETNCIIGLGPHWNTRQDLTSGQTCMVFGQLR